MDKADTVALLIVLVCLVVVALVVVVAVRRGQRARVPAVPVMRTVVSNGGGGPAAGTAAEVIARYRLGSAPYLRLIPPMAEELRQAQRAGKPLAVQILRSYADAAADAARSTLGTTGATAHWELVAVDGSITSADHERPAVNWQRACPGNLPFNLARLDELGVHPYIHLTAAVRALTDVPEVDEADADRAWFLLAMWISTNIGADARMLDPDRTLVVDLIACCSHLHTLTGGPPPAYATDAIERGLVLRHFDSVWVETAKVMTEDGQVYSEGHNEEYDSDAPLPVGALLAAQFRRDADAGTAEGQAELELGVLLAEAHALDAARAALDRARRDPRIASAADEQLTELFAAEVAMELQNIFRAASPRKGTPQRDRVVQLGRELEQRGGVALMADAVRHFRRLNAAEVRSLELSWDGIGDWRG